MMRVEMFLVAALAIGGCGEDSAPSKGGDRVEAPRPTPEDRAKDRANPGGYGVLPREFPAPPAAEDRGGFVFENGRIKAEFDWTVGLDEALLYFERELAAKGWAVGERFTNGLGDGVLLPAEGRGFKGSVLLKPTGGSTNVNVTLERDG